MKVIKNGKLRNMTKKEIAEYEKSIEITVEMQIQELKEQLTATDYKAIKYAEGLLTLDEYEPIREQRQAWRDEINKLETEGVTDGDS